MSSTNTHTHLTSVSYTHTQKRRDSPSNKIPISNLMCILRRSCWVVISVHFSASSTQCFPLSVLYLSYLWGVSFSLHVLFSVFWEMHIYSKRYHYAETKQRIIWSDRNASNYMDLVLRLFNQPKLLLVMLLYDDCWQNHNVKYHICQQCTTNSMII